MAANPPVDSQSPEELEDLTVEDMLGSDEPEQESEPAETETVKPETVETTDTKDKEPETETPVQEESQTNESEETEEAPPLQERFEEFTKPFKEAEESPTKTLEGNIAQLEEQVKAYNIYDGLKTSDEYAPSGKSVYTMNDGELNQYLIELRDKGQELLATQIVTARQTAYDRASQLANAQNTLNEHKQNLAVQQNQLEWTGVENEWVEKIPELKDHVQKIANYIDQKQNTDLTFKAGLQNRNGKMQAVYDAIVDLNLMGQVTQEPAEIKTPSAPDAKLKSKKVKTKPQGTFSKSEIAKIPWDSNEFGEVEKQLEEALFSGGITD